MYKAIKLFPRRYFRAHNTKFCKLPYRIERRLEEKKRALYVRLPHTIRDKKDVEKLFTGDFKVNLLRQSKRYCYVIFADTKQKLQNLRAAKQVKVNGKCIKVAPAKTRIKEKIINRKKIVIPAVKKDIKITRNLFISNIKCGTKRSEIQAAIPNCVSVTMLQPYSHVSRAAIVKMESAFAAGEYLTKTKEWPTVQGRVLRICSDTRRKRRNSGLLKIYDGETEVPLEKIKTEQKL